MRREGFTLLEVMVAVAILALSLTAIFSSEAGSVRMAHKSRKMGLGALLVRCKMGEIEEQLAVEGLPAVFDSGSDGCCEDGEVEGYTCDWEINPVVLPDSMFGGDEEEEEGGPGRGASSFDPQSTNPTDLLSGGGDMSGLTGMALQIVYPVLKPYFEGQIRRVTVTVKWKEGSAEKAFDVTQFVVADQPTPLEEKDEEEE